MDIPASIVLAGRLVVAREFTMPYTQVMSKWKAGKLHSGSPTGPKVKSQKQAVAIMLSEKRAAQAGKKEYQAHQDGGPVQRTEHGYPKDTDIPLPSLKKGETGPPSPSVPPRVAPNIPKPQGDMEGAKKGGPIRKFNKGGEVPNSSTVMKGQNLAETLANPTGRTGFKKGGAVEGRGWRRWGSGHSGH
jgi:hypothetical protein